MKIAIDLTSLYGRKHTGIELYAIDLYRALLKTEHEIVPVFHVKNEIDENTSAYIIPHRNRLWLENISLSHAIRNIHPDIALFPVFAPPLDIYNTKGIKIVPTVHDLAFLKYRHAVNPKAKFYLIPKRKKSLSESDAIITISETEKKQIESITSIPVFNCGENIAKEYVDAKSYIDIEFLKQWNLSPNDYYISVSTVEPRKNLKYLLKVIGSTLKSKNKKLVLVGRRGWGDDYELKKLIENLKEYIIFTEYVSLECLFSLYHYSYAFTLLSLDEGFGRTPFEAVACGCKRIILSDIPIFRETFHDNATFIPLDEIKKASDIYNNDCYIEVKDCFDIPFDIMEQRLSSFIESINIL